MSLAPRPAIICENCAGSNEDVILDGNAIPKKDATLDGQAITNSNSSLNESVVANITVFPEYRPAQNMGKGPYPRPLAD
jgi:hypothetical protein